MYVYFTHKFREKVEKHSLQEKVAKLCSGLERADDDMYALRMFLESFPPYWKRREQDLRLIAKLQRLESDHVLCFLDIMKREDKDYQKLLADSRQFGRDHLDPLIDPKDIQNWLKELKAKESTQQRQIRQYLPDNIRPWLDPPSWYVDADEMDLVVYESEEWVRRFRRRKIQDYWQTYYDIISTIVSDPDSASELKDWPGIKLLGKDNRYVLFSIVETVDTPPRKLLLLHVPLEHNFSPEELGQVIKGSYSIRTFAEAIAPPKKLRLDEVIPFALRVYPWYILADKEIWLDIEREEGSNLALSSEEEQVLKSVSMPIPGNSSLPLFINGRAGSGKSTMLFYLFADYCYRKWKQDLPGVPLFLTYNERLLEVAKDSVRKLLSSHHKFLANGTSSNISSIDAFFQPFQKFLISLLPIDERERFDPEKYISFHHFKLLYMGEPSHWTSSNEHKEREKVLQEQRLVLHLPEARRWSPETCWYVIRTFIKGYRLDGYMDSDDYLEVPRGERTVSSDMFKQIYETIFKSWYMRITTDQGYWDDQDLVRKVLELKRYHPEYTVIFCDEAQDFTRLEIQLIMRLSVFPQYVLGHQPILSLPFAFAGDPFQTLNPTGFRWSGIKGVFYDEIISAVDPLEELNISINFQELAYNYRSAPPIVRVSNLIQLWRHVLFELKELLPQMWWYKGEFPSPVKFILDQNISVDELKKHVQNTIIILPCEEGQESSYIQEDGTLHYIFKTSKGETPKNVLSAITAKGLEFNRVILYKFGEACPKAIGDLLNQSGANPVEFEYFFNKLYVAASRAKERLFVVDSKEGEKKLWEYASNNDNLQLFIKKANNQQIWEDRVQIIHPALGTDAQCMSEDNPLSIAQEFETKGLNLMNSALLRRASQYYIIVGEASRSGFCEAWALHFEGRLSEAGNIFLEHGYTEEAQECFWEEMCWKKLVEWYEKYGNEEKVIKRDIAIFMVTKPKDVNAIKTFAKFLENCIESNQLGAPFSKQWRTVIKEYVSRVSDLDEHVFRKDEWEQLGNVLEKLGNTGHQGAIECGGTCFYRAQNYHRAVSCWERSNITQNRENREYYMAKAESLGFPGGLKWLSKLSDQDERILLEWEKAGGLVSATDQSWLEYVLPALERMGRYFDAFHIYMKLGNTERLLECFAQAYENSSSTDTDFSTDTDLRERLVSLIQYLTQRCLWNEISDVLDKYFPAVIGSDHEKADLLFDIVHKIACSDLNPEVLTRDVQVRYGRLVEKVQSIEDWRNKLSPKELGAAMERTVGLFVDILRFYEQFVFDHDPEIRKFARERWIANKKKHEDYLRKQGQNNRANEVHNELVENAQKWGIGLDVNFTQYPQLMPKLTIGLRGVPDGTKVEELPNGEIKFKVGRIEVKIDGSNKRVQFVYTEDFTTVLTTVIVNLKDGHIDSLGEVVTQTPREGHLSFQVPTSHYSGTAFYGGENPLLELRIEGLPESIFLEF